MSSDAKTNKFLAKINEKSEQLRTNDLTRDDQELLKNNRREHKLNRLELIWCEELDSQDSTATIWRRSRARQLYREIQDVDAHLFLAFVLAISPTECIKKSFGINMEHLGRIENYEPYRLKLSQATKRFFESTATDQGFARSHRYLNFMNALFPPNAEILDDPQSPDDHSPNSHSTVLPRSLKRKGAPADSGYPEHTPGATDSLGPEHPDAFTLRRLLDDPPNNNEDARQNPTPSPTTSTNTPPLNETQREPTTTTISEISSNKAYFPNTQEERVFERASLQRLGQVFDPFVSNAIERVKVKIDGMTSLKAAVTMVFPSWGVDCLMSFNVDASKTEYLAMALFNVRVESVENVRYVSMKGGVRLKPNPEIILKGVLDDAIIDVFGPEIHGAITACCMREKELEAGNDATDCVSMAFTSSLSEGATINLALGLEEGTRIQKKLYTRM